ncbi:MAG: biopolymer transporter ExbD [Phycisphaerae bacterium]|jgi:biopolymer transport protein ExbD|nr:biopolymer transporter ExbD [Phycisphaerae bacterium]MBT5366009.1 biopolymer transporter ExbD [Phycisphaerae bacterium]MBT6269223.1 biopolymer transporter ExbD [Phycisphaerae bacterium]MBT6282940.1 biopolymer transporter ExbD [Phycisphaerae bacterium]
MQFAKSNRRGINRATLSLSSMIDVTFLLLIYFIVTTVLSKPEDQLNPALLIDQGSVVEDSLMDPQIIYVQTKNLQPVYKLGSQQFSDRSALAEVLKVLPKEPGIIIKADDSVTVGFAVAAIQESRDAGFTKVTYVPASN